MLGIGFGEMVMIAVLVLIAVGPNRLPGMLKSIAKTYRQFRRAAQDIRSTTGIDDFLRDEELKELAELRKQKLSALAMQSTKPKVAGPLSAEDLAAKQQMLAAQGQAAPALSPDQLAAKEAMIGHKIPVDGGPGEEATMPALRAGDPGADAVRGLSYKQRVMENPPEGPDVVEAAFRTEKPELGVVPDASIPKTRDGSGDDAFAEGQLDTTHAAKKVASS